MRRGRSPPPRPIRNFLAAKWSLPARSETSAIPTDRSFRARAASVTSALVFVSRKAPTMARAASICPVADLALPDQRGQLPPVPSCDDGVSAGVLVAEPREEVVGERPDGRAHAQMQLDEPVLDRPFRSARPRAAPALVDLDLGPRSRDPVRLGVAGHGRQRGRQGGETERRLGRHLDVLAGAGPPPGVMGEQCAAGRVGRGMKEGLRDADAQGRPHLVLVVGQRTSGSPDRQVGRVPVRFGAGAAKGCDRDVHQPGIDRPKVIPPEAEPIELAWAARLDQEVGAGREGRGTRSGPPGVPRSHTTPRLLAA